jgi:hypothetical protein
MSKFQAKRCDQAIDRRAHRVALSSQGAVVLGGGYGQVTSARVKNVELLEIMPNSSEGLIVSNPL